MAQKGTKESSGKVRFTIKPGQKIFLVALNVPIQDPNHFIEKMGDNFIVLSLVDIKRLEKLSEKDTGGKAYSAKLALDALDALKFDKNGVEKKETFNTGVSTPWGGTVVVDYNGKDSEGIPYEIDRDDDSRLIAIAKAWETDYPKVPVIVISKKPSQRITAEACELKAENYRGDRYIDRPDQLYTGHTKFRVKWLSFIRKLEEKGEAPDLHNIGQSKKLLANQCCTISYKEKGEEKSVLTYYKKKDKKFIFVAKPQCWSKEEAALRKYVGPINNEQAYAMALMKDPGIHLVEINGDAGSGKNYLTLLYGYEALKEKSYKTMKIFRPNMEIFKEMGHLPGTIEKKFAPYAEAVYDNLKVIIENGKPEIKEAVEAPKVIPKAEAKKAMERKKRKEKKKKKSNGFNNQKEKEPEPDDDEARIMSYFTTGKIEIGPVNFIQGRTFDGDILVFDEIQNFQPEFALLFGSRAGFRTKVIMMGDNSRTQIRNAYNDLLSNGLVHVIEKMKDHERTATIKFLKSERSELAQLFIDRMAA